MNFGSLASFAWGSQHCHGEGKAEGWPGWALIRFISLWGCLKRIPYHETNETHEMKRNEGPYPREVTRNPSILSSFHQHIPGHRQRPAGRPASQTGRPSPRNTDDRGNFRSYRGIPHVQSALLWSPYDSGESVSPTGATPHPLRAAQSLVTMKPPLAFCQPYRSEAVRRQSGFNPVIGTVSPSGLRAGPTGGQARKKVTQVDNTAGSGHRQG